MALTTWRLGNSTHTQLLLGPLCARFYRSIVVFTLFAHERSHHFLISGHEYAFAPCLFDDSHIKARHFSKKKKSNSAHSFLYRAIILKVVHCYVAVFLVDYDGMARPCTELTFCGPPIGIDYGTSSTNPPFTNVSYCDFGRRKVLYNWLKILSRGMHASLYSAANSRIV